MKTLPLRKRCRSLGFILLFVFVNTSLTGWSQDASSDSLTASDHINSFKDGTLLVRLKSGSNKIKALKSKGYDRKAQEVLEEIREKNFKVMEAFRNGYTFTPVYFFYNTDSKEIKEGKFKGNMLNKDLERDPSIVPERSPYYIVQIGNVYSEAFQSNIDGLVAMDQDLQQLKDPFPYYVKKRAFLVVDRSTSDMVKIWNDKLDKYYRQEMEY